jgi:hypothetical protein
VRLAKRGKMRTLLLAGISVSMLETMTASLALAGTCPGQAQVHDSGDYRFETSSWVKNGLGVVEYWTCVQNDSDRALFFDWFIPGPSGWVGPHDIASNRRNELTRETQPWDGCLQYGNFHKPMRAQFLGHESDRQKVSEEKTAGCDQSREYFGQTTATISTTVSNLNYEAQVLVPSDGEHADDTLLRISASIGLETLDAYTYRSSLRFNIVPVGYAAKGVPTDLRIRTKSPELTTGMIHANKIARFGDAIPIKSAETEIVLNLNRPKYFELTDAQYLIYDRNDTYVGAIYMPVLHELSGG